VCIGVWKQGTQHRCQNSLVVEKRKKQTDAAAPSPFSPVACAGMKRIAQQQKKKVASTAEEEAAPFLEEESGLNSRKRRGWLEQQLEEKSGNSSRRSRSV